MFSPKRPCVHSRTEQLQASSTYSHPYVSEEHAFRIHMAPAEPLCLTPCCTEPQDKGDTGRANGRWACSHESDVPGYLNGPNLVHAVLADHQHPRTVPRGAVLAPNCFLLESILVKAKQDQTSTRPHCKSMHVRLLDLYPAAVY